MKYAVYFGSREIYENMWTSAKSLVANSDVDKIFFLIEDDEFPFELSPVVETINMSGKVWEIYSERNPNSNARWTYMGLLRTCFTKIFPDIDKILSIDCDTIVEQDVSDLWDIDIKDYYYAGVREPILSRNVKGVYINAGVMMCNLKKLRDGKEDEMIHLLDTKKLFFVCQDAINACCQGSILEIPNDYNKTEYTGLCFNPKIVHFAGKHGWQTKPEVVKWHDSEWAR